MHGALVWACPPTCTLIPVGRRSPGRRLRALQPCGFGVGHECSPRLERRLPARHSHIEAASSHVTCGTSELPRPPQSRPETEAGTRTGSWVTDSCPLRNFTCQLAEQQVCKTQHSTFCSQDEHVSRSEVSPCSGICGLRSNPRTWCICLSSSGLWGPCSRTLDPQQGQWSAPTLCPSPPEAAHRLGGGGGRQLHASERPSPRLGATWAKVLDCPSPDGGLSPVAWGRTEPRAGPEL